MAMLLGPGVGLTSRYMESGDAGLCKHVRTATDLLLELHPPPRLTPTPAQPRPRARGLCGGGDGAGDPYRRHLGR